MHTSVQQPSRLHVYCPSCGCLKAQQHLISHPPWLCLEHGHCDKRAITTAFAVVERPPVFDEPARRPSQKEAQSVLLGATLTPEQRLAKQLELPVTLRIRTPPGAPTDRQLMTQIQAAATWQDLEAAVYQRSQMTPIKSSAAAGQQQAGGASRSGLEQQPQKQEAPSSSSSSQRAVQQLPQQQQQQQPGADVRPVQRQPRRRQQPQPLSVQPATQISATSALQQPSSTTGSIDRSCLLNHMHTTEAFRQLIKLLPQHPRQLPPAARSRVATLISFLSQQAQLQAQTMDLDPRGIAHVAAALGKLGHKDEGLIAALQEAALLQIEQFSGQHVAMLLGACVNLKISPDAQLLDALQQHILHNLHLFKHQSIANTIWALAKLTQSSSSQLAGVGTADQLETAKQTAHSNKANSGTGTVSSSVTTRAGLVAALVQRCYPQMHFWTGRHLAQTAWALGLLGARPDEQWSKGFLLAARKRLSKMSPQDLSNLITALPELQIVPDADWIDTFCTTAAAKMRLTQAVGLYSILFGLAKIKRRHCKAAAKALKQQKDSYKQLPVSAHQGISQPAEPQQLQQQQAPTQQVQQLARAEAHTTSVAQAALASGSQPITGATETASLNVTLGELKLLRAAVMWLDRLQGSLADWQLVGTIMSLSELLPAHILRAAGAAARQLACAESIKDQSQNEQAQQQQQQHQADQVVLPVDKHQQLLATLAMLLHRWQAHVDVSSLAQGLPKRQAGLLRVAWNRLTGHKLNESV